MATIWTSTIWTTRSLIFEVDDALPEANVSVSPATVGNAGETESRYPFIHIEFNGLTNDDDEDVQARTRNTA